MTAKTKVLALVITIMFVLTVCPFSGFAAETVDELIIDDVTGSQVATAITEDLSLPAGFTWTSSDEEVISIGTEAEGVIPATVTRQIGVDKTVTLTASAGESTKEFALVVLAKETKVIASGTSAGGQQDVLTKFTKAASNFIDENATSTLTIEQDTSGNYYQKYNFENTSNYDYNELTEDEIALMNGAESVTFEFDFKYDVTVANPVDLILSMPDMKSVKLAKWRGSDRRIYVGGKSAYKTYDAGWNHIKLELDMYTGEIKGTLTNASGSTVWTSDCFNDIYNAQDFFDASVVGVQRLFLAKGSAGSDCGTFLLDNFVVFAKLPETLSAEDQKTYIESINWSDYSDEDASAVTAISNAFGTDGGFINWSSDNSAIAFTDISYTTTDETITKIAGKTATVTRPDGKLNTNVIITATHKDGAEYGEKKFNVSILPNGYLTDFQSGSLVSRILEDFESGTAGEDVTYVTDEGYNKSGDSAWANASTTPADFTYVLDSGKGMAAKISGDGKYMYIKSGAESNIHNSATVGMDIKFAEGDTEDSNVRIQLWSAVPTVDIYIKEGKIGINTLARNDFNGVVWYDADTSNWMRIDVDTNFVSRTNDIYLNGVKLNTEPLTNWFYYTKTSISGVIRTVKFSTKGTTELLVDNISVTCADNADKTLAEAAINAAYLYYNGDTVTSSLAFPQTGPAYAAMVDFATDGIAMTGGATLTWKENGEAVTALNPTSPVEHTYSLTATSGSETAAGSVKIKGTPVIISVNDNGSVSLEGNTEGGTLIVATMDGDKLATVKAYTNFEGISVSDIASYKLIFIDSFANLAPLAFAVSK